MGAEIIKVCVIMKAPDVILGSESDRLSCLMSDPVSDVEAVDRSSFYTVWVASSFFS